MNLQLHQIVLLFPAATAIHFLEEASRFTAWAQKYISRKFTQSRWNRIHAFGLLYASAFSVIVARYPNRFVVFLFFGFCFSESVMNTLFHTGATLWFRSYSPGLFTALALYPALFWFTIRLALQEGLLNTHLLFWALLLAAVVHTVDVSCGVFFRLHQKN